MGLRRIEPKLSSLVARPLFSPGGQGSGGGGPPPNPPIPALSPSSGFVGGGLVSAAFAGGVGPIKSVALNGVPVKWFSVYGSVLRFSYFPTSVTGSVNLTVTYSDLVSRTKSFTLNQSTIALTQTNLAGVTPGPATYMPTANFAFMGWDGNIWWSSTQSPASTGVGSMWNMTTAGVVTQFPVAANGNLVDGCAGPDGNIYGLEQRSSGGVAGVLWKVVLPGGSTSSVTLATPANLVASGPYVGTNVCVGPDANLWVSAIGFSAGSILFRITPSGSVTAFPISTYGAGIIIANKNGNFYVAAKLIGTDANVIRLLEVTPNGAVLSNGIVTGALSMTAGLAYGPDGNIWAADVVIAGPQSAQGILRIPPANFSATSRFTVTCDEVCQVVAGPDGNIWTANSNIVYSALTTDSSFSMITTAGVVTTTVAPGSNDSSQGQLFGITTGPDGKLYIPVHIFRQALAQGYVIKVT